MIVTITYKRCQPTADRYTRGILLTVTMAPTIVMMTLAIAEMMALMAPPIAETIEPCRVSQLGHRCRSHSEQLCTHHC